MTGSDLSALAGKMAKRQRAADKRLLSGAMLTARTLLNQVAQLTKGQSPIDGVTLDVVREAGTGRILSVHVTPVDVVDGKAVPRYAVALEAVSH